MAVEGKQVMLYIRKVVRLCIRISYRSACDHPILFSLGLLLYILNRSSPALFTFLLSSSPVIICTTLLLGVLLSYGDTNLPEVDEDDKIAPEISALKVGTSSGDIHVKTSQEGPSAQAFTEIGRDIKGREIKETAFIRERASEHVELDDDVPLLRQVDGEDERVDTSLNPISFAGNINKEVQREEKVSINNKRELEDTIHATPHEDVFPTRVDDEETVFGPFSSSMNVKKAVDMEGKLNEEREFSNPAVGEKRKVSEERPAKGVVGTSRASCGVSVRQRKKLAEIKMETSKATEDSQLDSSLGSPWARADSHDGSSGFDSDRMESSSPDASMGDIAPVLDEIDPLLGSESARPDPIPKDDSDGESHSHISSHDPQIDDDSNEEAENHEAGEDGSEKKKDDGKETAFMWTADDEKNLMDLGYSEMERNRRLESLMAKRRSRKNIIYEIDQHLIDIDNNDAGRGMEELSRFHVQVPSISVTRKNPFDLPYDSEEAAIPSSAPSVLHPRKNPFDLPFDQSYESGIPAREALSPREFMMTSHRDMFFRRHDSFNFGWTETSQEKRFSRFKPFFVPEAVHTEEGSSSNFQRQFSDKSDSKLSSVMESNTVSSVTDQERDLQREHEVPSLTTQDRELAEDESECSDDVNSVDVELDNSDIDDREIPLQHFVFERTQQREALLASAKGKGPEEMISGFNEAAGSSTHLVHHAVSDLISWEDGVGESSLGNTTVESSQLVSSPRPAEEKESGSAEFGAYLNTAVGSSSSTIVLGANHPSERDGAIDISYSNNAVTSDGQASTHSTMEASSEFGNETSQVISRDLHPIPEEAVLDFNNSEEKHEMATFTDSVAGLTGLQVIEEHFAVGSDGSSSVHSSAPVRDGDVIQSPLLEPAESSKTFIFTATRPTEAARVDKKEETTQSYIVDSDEEADKIYPEPLEDNGIDENFLSELDAVGDFRVEELRLDREVPDLGLRTGVSPQTCSDVSMNLSEAIVKDSDERQSSISNLKGVEHEYGWLSGTSHSDPEQTVYNPRRRVLEESSLEEMNMVFKRPREESRETEVPSVGDSTAANVELGSGDLVAKTDTEMVVLDATSVEDIDADFKQVSEVADNSTVPDIGMHVVDAKSVDDIDAAFRQATEVADNWAVPDIGMHVVDAKSVDDIDAAFKEHSDGVVADSLEEIQTTDGYGKSKENEEHVLEVQPAEGDGTFEALGGGMGLEPTKAPTEMHVIEAKSLDDIDTAFRKLSDGDADNTVDVIEPKDSGRTERFWKNQGK